MMLSRQEGLKIRHGIKLPGVIIPRKRRRHLVSARALAVFGARRWRDAAIMLLLSAETGVLWHGTKSRRECYIAGD